MENSESATTARPSPGAVWRLPRVEQETGLRKSTLYQLMKDGKFVASVRLSARCVGWPAQAVEAWIEQRINASKGVA
jgi:prophage regulatory protein